MEQIAWGGGSMVALLLFGLLLATPAAAGEEVGIDRSSPQATMRGYLEACRDGAYERATRYLNLDPVPPDERAERGPVLAAQLKAVLDQKLWVDLESLSSEPAGHQEDGLAVGRDRVGELTTDLGSVGVFVDREVGMGDESEWRIAARTVSEIPRIAAELGVSPFIAGIPEPLRQIRLFEIALWQWLALALLVLLVWAAAWLLADGLVRLLRPVVARSASDFDDRLLALMLAPLRLILTVALFGLGTLVLQLSIPARDFFRAVEITLVVVGVTWLLLRAVDLGAAVLEERLATEQRDAAGHFVPIGARALKTAVAVMAGLAALDSFGLDVTAVIAGLGVGGIAVALAAQKTLENVFGGITILADQPVRPGEFCRFGDKIGTVEEIGLRSTRVRTLDRTVISVPNAEFSTLQIENFAARDRMRLVLPIGLRYETTPDQLRHVLVGLRALLHRHPRVLPDPLRVRLVGFGDCSLDVELYCYIDTADWDEFLAIREDVFLRVMDVVAESGTGFAFPSQTAYLARDDGLDAEKAARAKAQVDEWRRTGELMFPDHSPESAESIQNSLDWPPAGSPTGGKP
jgi:MscS family membrane protein